MAQIKVSAIVLLALFSLPAFAGDAVVGSATIIATEQCDGSTGNAAIVCRWIDPLTGSDSNAGTAAAPWLTIGKAITYVETDVGNTTIMLVSGTYPEFVWQLSAGLEHTTTWKSVSVSVKFDGMNLSCASLCRANQIFDNINFELAAQGSRGVTNIAIDDITHVEIRNSEIHNVNLYQAEGLKISASYNITIRDTVIHDVLHALRYNGNNHLFTGLEIHRVPGSNVSMFLCNLVPGAYYSARHIEISNFWFHDQVGDYPDEPFYEDFDEPAELHASILSIRGRDVIIKDGWINNIEDSIVMQFYEGEAGCENSDIATAGYDIRNITVERVVAYGLPSGEEFLQSTASPTGRIVLRSNTIIGTSLGVTFSKNPGYGGEGSIAVNNLIMDAGFASMTDVNYEFLVDQEATITNNFAEFPTFPARNYYIASGRWYVEGFDSTNKFISAANHLSIQVAVPNGAPEFGLGYEDTDVFENPDYAARAELCAPKGTDDCDWTPKSGSAVCSMGSGGGHVGAIPCS